ncbi:MAG TPA: malto-oligosyltrehalose synthase [Verrucomicrobiae bacterium]|nr:malto-oligosyltrehalose synthase [Verrucomicrobiae bacterium]
MKELQIAAENHPRWARIPGSTYRLQLNSSFTFAEALTIVDYLRQLGVTDCYASPILTARPESTHGYDVCDCAEINPQAGGFEEFERWSAYLRKAGFGLLLDIVPNHMSASLHNPWWRDVLENGPDSSSASWFDIDWESNESDSVPKVLLPILEEPYWRVLESGKLRLIFDGGMLALACAGHVFPLSPQSRASVQQELLEMCRQAARETESLEELNALGEMALQLNSRHGRFEAEPTGKVFQVVAPPRDRPRIWPSLKRALKRFNGTVGDPESFNALHALIQQQHYRLAWWRLGNENTNYRRFFDVTDLVALRMESPEVFEATHRLVLRLARQGKITGLRVDHPDGLWDPKKYFVALQESFHSQDDTLSPEDEFEADPNAHVPSADRGALYIVAEKILTGSEPLPQDWPIAGTTGYDFLNLLNGLFVNGANRQALDDLYFEFSGAKSDFPTLVFEAKLKILQTSMLGDLRRLARQLRSLCAHTRYGQDFSPSELRRALATLIATFPVYRTYTTETSESPSAQDAAVIDEAFKIAIYQDPAADTEILGFIRDLLFLKHPADLDENGIRACRQFVMRFQQLTGPVMAKGLEDTAFYNYNRLISLNEVGGAPDQFGTDLHAFHTSNQRRAQYWTHSLLATATHDTKRGEDMRARINVLSEIPGEWRQAVLKWSRLNSDQKSFVDGQPAPSPNDEYFLYQTLIGAWTSEAENNPGAEGFLDRISQYMLKALRESKAHTSWTQPNAPYENATHLFVQQILKHSPSNTFLDDFMLFHRNIAVFGVFNSLAQVVLKLTSPGVPDFYQGTELWDYSLVDPDNRRPVNYDTRRALLTELQQKAGDSGECVSLVKSLLKNYQTGQIKLYTIWRVLDLRARRRDLFESGEYAPLSATGGKQEHICAFARRGANECVIAVAARLMMSLGRGAQRAALEPDVWQQTALPVAVAEPGARFRDVLTQQVISVGPDRLIPIATLLSTLPVAVLEPI